MDQATYRKFVEHELQSKIEDAVRSRNIAIENLTARQVATVIMQAAAAGDIQRHIRVDTGSQCVTYIPYAMEQQLRSRIQRLEDSLKAQGIEDPDKLEPEINDY